MKTSTGNARAGGVGVAIFILIACFTWGAITATRTVDQKEFAVIGISARTNNAQEALGNGVIAKQWEKFYKEGILDKLPYKADANTYVVYSDYASDKNGDYSYTIGAKVTAASTVPPGMVAKIVSAGKYAVITSERGPIPKINVDAWQRIWDLEDRAQLGGKRAYKADFEVYDQRARDSRDSQIDIYVGVK